MMYIFISFCRCPPIIHKWNLNKHTQELDLLHFRCALGSFPSFRCTFGCFPNFRCAFGCFPNFRCAFGCFSNFRCAVECFPNYRCTFWCLGYIAIGFWCFLCFGGFLYSRSALWLGSIQNFGCSDGRCHSFGGFNFWGFGFRSLAGGLCLLNRGLYCLWGLARWCFFHSTLRGFHKLLGGSFWSFPFRAFEVNFLFTVFVSYKGDWNESKNAN